jgi:16S rRNA processing protein RimM
VSTDQFRRSGSKAPAPDDGVDKRRRGLVGVGCVGRPHGRDGSFFVEEASDAPERFAPEQKLIVDGEPATVLEAKRAGGRLVVRLDRPVRRGARLEVPRSALPPPGPDSYYVFDLIGLPVEEEGGRVLGRVEHVEAGVANDVLELDSGLALPLVEDCVREVDLERGRIVVASGFADPG